MHWITATLQTYPEIAVFLSLAVGYWIGNIKVKGFSLGSVTATLLAAIVVGQLNIPITGPLKSFAFLMFLFAVGYGIGPQFVRGIAKDGLPQALFALIQCVFSLAVPVVIAMIAGYNLGSAAGLYSGSQTISAAMGLSTDAINRLGLSADQTKQLLDSMPVAYAVTYIFGTIGSAILLAQILPKIMGVNLHEACLDYEKKYGPVAAQSSVDGTAWHEYELRAYSIGDGNCAAGLAIGAFEAKFPGHKVFVEGLRRGGKLMDACSKEIIRLGDVLAIGGDHDAVVSLFKDTSCYQEVNDEELLSQPVSGVDVYVSSKEVGGKTLHDLAGMADAHGVFLRRIKRGLAGTEIPIMPSTTLHRGDVITIFGLEKDVKRAAKELGVIDERTTVADVAYFSAAIVIGALIGALIFRIHGVPITLSTAGGALIAGLIAGWVRSVHPTFGYIPEPTVWFMNSVGLNIFIAIVGLTAGPNFVAGLQQLGISLFLWGVAATSVPLILGAIIAKYVFKFHPAILFGCCAGARTTTAALGMINEQARSTIPGLGYTVTYAVGNTFLTIWGLIIIMVLS